MTEQIQTPHPENTNPNLQQLTAAEVSPHAEVVPMSTIEAASALTPQLPSTETNTPSAEAAPTDHAAPSELARLTFRIAGNTLGPSLADFANDRQRGIFDRLKQRRGSTPPTNPNQGNF